MAEDITPNEEQPKAVVSHHSRFSNPSKLIRALFILVIVAAIALIVLMLRQPDPTKTVQPSFTPAPTATVNITASGYVPATLKVKAGTIVTWTNTDQVGHSVATNSHPEHNDLSDLKSDPLIKDQTYHYKFTKAGTYNYHDEQKLTSGGTIIVE